MNEKITARPRLESEADRTTVVTMIDTEKQKDYLIRDTHPQIILPASFIYTGMVEEPPRDFTRAILSRRCV